MIIKNDDLAEAHISNNGLYLIATIPDEKGNFISMHIPMNEVTLAMSWYYAKKMEKLNTNY